MRENYVNRILLVILIVVEKKNVLNDLCERMTFNILNY